MKRALILPFVLALAACGRKTSSAVADAAPREEAAESGGSIDIAYDEEKTTLQVGAAYAIPAPRDEGNLFYFMLFNKGVTGTSCKTEIDGNKPVGGNNWALSFDMVSGSEAFGPKDSNKTYDDINASLFFVSTKGPWKGEARKMNPFGSSAETTFTIVSVDSKMVKVKVDITDGDDHVRGAFFAKLCPPSE